MRIKNNINLGIISGFNTKFSELTLYYKDCMVDSQENYKFDLGVKELTFHFILSTLSIISINTITFVNQTEIKFSNVIG